MIRNWKENGIFCTKSLEILDYHRIVEVALSFIKIYYKIIGVKDWNLMEILGDEIMPSHPDNVNTLDTKDHSPELYHGHIEYLCYLLDNIIPKEHALNARLKKLLRYHERVHIL